MPRILAVSIYILSQGCAEFRPDQALSGLPSDCTGQTAATLLDQPNQLGPLTDTHTLSCALAVLSDSQDKKLLSSALGSRLCLHLAERQANQDQREKFATEGVRLAENALTQGGNDNGAVHYYLAANLGLSVRDHMTIAVANLGRLENEMKQAVALSPDIDDGGPLRLLGALYLKAPAWPAGIGDIDKALELLEKAVNNHPKHPLNHLFYAQALWQDDENANLTRVKSEFALGNKLLAEGHWGYNKEPWQREFTEFAHEFIKDVSLLE